MGTEWLEATRQYDGLQALVDSKAPGLQILKGLYDLLTHDPNNITLKIVMRHTISGPNRSSWNMPSSSSVSQYFSYAIKLGMC
mmetsp:Transcript_24101/g.74291  ORF Transcript_24101/g.74291 Transcript_24101/m.74291 type:complete len:83 (+) Transcript_24101:286-534(+)